MSTDSSQLFFTSDDLPIYGFVVGGHYMTYHNTLLFSFELTLIYEHLKDFPQLTSV